MTCLLYMINVANIVENVYHVDERWKKHFHTTKEYISIASSGCYIAVKFMSEKIKYSYEKNETACIYSEILQRVNIFILCIIIIDTIRTKPPVLDRILKFCFAKNFVLINSNEEKRVFKILQRKNIFILYR